MKEIIELRNITKVYVRGNYKLYALKDVSLKVREGEFLAIMGPSGSGKTTLLNIISLIDKPTSGEYLLEGRRIKSFDESSLTTLRRKYFGFIFQQFYLIPSLNVEENVELPLIFKGVPKRKRKVVVKRLLKRIGLRES